MGTLRLHYEENNILRPIGALILLKLKVTKIPIQNRAKLNFFLVPAMIAEYTQWRHFYTPGVPSSRKTRSLYSVLVLIE